MTSSRKALADQRGFTMVTVIMTMMILSLFAVGAWAAANNDLPTGRQDIDRKRAYEAAQAGLQWYAYQLSRDTNYWTYCGDATKTPAFVQMQGTRTSWRLVSGGDTNVSTNSNANQAQFAIEMMPDTPGTTNAACLASPSSTLLDSGVLRVRSTGGYNGKFRQVIGTFRRSGFLDYVWYTKWETQSPQVYDSGDVSWAANNCAIGRNSRDNCKELQFPTDDAIKGPMHTEDDSLLVCGSPTFGRNADDKIEIVGATTQANASVGSGGCSDNPDWLGTLQFPAKSVDLPASNTALATVADKIYTGTTCLQFNAGDTMSVYSNLTCTGSPSSTVTLGADTTIWVANNGSCPSGYTVDQKYTNDAKCGDVGVKGTYSKNITIGAADDIVVIGNLTHTGDGLMGLVANQFVRVYHPVSWSSGNCGNNSGNGGNTYVSFIDAAILATNGSFLADNATCGDDLGTLKIQGAIAQKWRGIIGQTQRFGNGSSIQNGYLKDYNYDDRLRYREPPNFLDPVTVTWNVLRQSEQTPVKSGTS
jgi:Tfp pilus assembly protein PilX